MLSQYFPSLVKFSFRVNSCNKWHHQNISRNLYILNIVVKLQNCTSRTPLEMVNRTSGILKKKSGVYCTWSMEDFLFHPCLSTLVRIMIFWCKTCWENIQDSIKLSSSHSFVLLRKETCQIFKILGSQTKIRVLNIFDSKLFLHWPSQGFYH